MIRQFLLVILLTSIFHGAGAGNVPAHAFHTSLAQLNYNAREKVLEVSLRLFTDDLEMALTRESGQQKIKLDASAQHDKLIEQYISKQFSLRDAKGHKKAVTFVGKEFEADATWIYLEIPLQESLSGMSLQNALLTEVYEDQTNVVNLTYLTVKKTYLFKTDDTLQELR